MPNSQLRRAALSCTAVLAAILVDPASASAQSPDMQRFLNNLNGQIAGVENNIQRGLAGMVAGASPEIQAWHRNCLVSGYARSLCNQEAVRAEGQRQAQVRVVQERQARAACSAGNSAACQWLTQQHQSRMAHMDRQIQAMEFQNRVSSSIRQSQEGVDSRNQRLHDNSMARGYWDYANSARRSGNHSGAEFYQQRGDAFHRRSLGGQ